MRFSLLIICLIIFSISFSQDIGLHWVKTAGGANPDFANASGMDGAGNLYVAGSFRGTCDFDPAAGNYQLTSKGDQDIFVAKYDPDGLLIWAKSMGGSMSEAPSSIYVDAAGNFSLTGNFRGSVDFDPGAGDFILNAMGESDVFVATYDAGGNFNWAKQVGGLNRDEGNCIAGDGNGNFYIVGSFRGSNADFDPGPGTYLMSAPLNNSAAFILKLTAAGDYVWAGNINSDAEKIKVYSGNLYITGAFDGTTDFDIGPGTTNLTSKGATDIFILKMDMNGQLAWALQMGGEAGENSVAIDFDSDGNIYTAGYIISSSRFPSDFDPGPGDYFLQSHGSTTAIFISKLSTIGNFIWARIFYGPVSSELETLANSATDIVVGPDKNIYLAGLFAKTLDFDPGSGEKKIESEGEWDSFLTGLDQQGDLIFVNTIKGPEDERGGSMIQNNNGSLYWIGSYATAANIDRCYRIALTDHGLSNFFITKFDRPVVTITSSALQICPGSPVQFLADVEKPGSHIKFQWSVNGINVGNDADIFTSSTLNNNDKISVIVFRYPDCEYVVSDTSNEITMVVYAVPDVTVTPAFVQVEIGEPVQISAQITGNYVNYIWEPAAGLNNVNTLNPIADPLVSTIYTLKVVTADNCTVRDTAQVKVIKKLFLPNTFTPNNDGINDVFRIPPGSDIILADFFVYDRNGNKIFHSKQVDNGWNGDYKGLPMPPGNYVYLITGTGTHGKILERGNVLVIR